jgi:hypothetical protein
MLASLALSSMAAISTDKEETHEDICVGTVTDTILCVEAVVANAAYGRASAMPASAPKTVENVLGSSVYVPPRHARKKAKKPLGGSAASAARDGVVPASQ